MQGKVDIRTQDVAVAGVGCRRVGRGERRARRARVDAAEAARPAGTTAGV